MLKVLLGFAAWCTMVSALLASGGGCGGGGGGGGGDCGFGGDSGRIFELPEVEEDVNVGGLTLTLDRTKWGYSFTTGGDGVLARFVGDDIEVTLRRISPPPASGRALVEALVAQSDVLYARQVATSGAVRGVKAAYGIRRGLALRNQTAVRYFLAISGQSWLCFEARPTGEAPQWQDANDLILGAKPDRTRT